MNKLKKNMCFVSFSVTLICYLIIFAVIGVKPFGDKTILIGDSLEQYIPFFSVLRNKLLDGSFTSLHNFSYSWFVGIGANFLLLFYYYLASPLNLILVFVSNDKIVSMVTILIAVKIAMAASSMSYYIKKHYKGSLSGGIVLAVSIAYAFSGYICGYYWNVMWLDSLIVFPIIILGLENIIEGESPILYIISLAFAMYLNFYMAFMICIFVCLAYIFADHKSIKDFLIRGITFAWSSILAAGMSALSLFVIYYGIGHTMTAGKESPSFGFFGNVFYTLRQAFFLTKPITVDRSRYDGFANLYSGVLFILCFFLFVFSDRITIKTKARRLVLIAILFISMNERVLNFIWHGFHEQFLIPNRFSFLMIFCVLTMTAEVLEDIRKMDKKRIMASCVFAVISPIVVFVFVDFDGLLAASTVVLINVIFLAIYSVILFVLKNYDLYRKIAFKVLISACCFEIVLNAFVIFKSNAKDVNLNKLDHLYSELEDNSSEKLFREEIYDKTISNADSYVGIKGADVFCSTMMGDTLYTMGDLGYSISNNNYSYRVRIPYSDEMLGIKKVYYYNESNEIEYFENSDSLAFGYSVNEDVMSFVPDSESYGAGNINSISKLATSVDENVYDSYSDKVIPNAYYGTLHESVDMYNSVYMERGDAEENALILSFDVVDEGDYYLELRATYSDYVTVILNNAVYIEGDSLVNGMVPLEGLKKGDKLEVYFESYLDTPIIWYLDRYNSDAAEKSLSVLAQNPLNITEFKEGDFSGDISIGDNQMLMLTIPYDKGWKVYDNGKEVETVPVLRGFTGLKLDAGDHNLRFVYTPEGFKIGLIISFISWFIFITYYVSVRYRKKKNSDINSNSETVETSEIKEISESEG